MPLNLAKFIQPDGEVIRRDNRMIQAMRSSLYGPDDVLKRAQLGWGDYHNTLAAQSIPNDLDVWAKLLNNSSGATNTEHLPDGITAGTLWNTGTNQFGFGEMQPGDTVDLRFNLSLVIATANTQVFLRMRMGIGGTEETLGFFVGFFKNAGTYPNISSSVLVPLSTNIKDNPAEVQIQSDLASTVTVNGFLVRAALGDRRVD